MHLLGRNFHFLFKKEPEQALARICRFRSFLCILGLFSCVFLEYHVARRHDYSAASCTRNRKSDKQRQRKALSFLACLYSLFKLLHGIYVLYFLGYIFHCILLYYKEQFKAIKRKRDIHKKILCKKAAQLQIC